MAAGFGGLPAAVRIVEVGPRDGLQNESGNIAVATRVGLIDRLADAGLTLIESGAFVSPKWVPQMAGTAQVLACIDRRPGICHPVLVPNMKGFEAALAHEQASGRPVEEIAVFAAASETFSTTDCAAVARSHGLRPPMAGGCVAMSRWHSAARTKETSIPGGWRQ